MNIIELTSPVSGVLREARAHLNQGFSIEQIKSAIGHNAWLSQLDDDECKALQHALNIYGIDIDLSTIAAHNKPVGYTFLGGRGGRSGNEIMFNREMMFKALP